MLLAEMYTIRWKNALVQRGNVGLAVYIKRVSCTARCTCCIGTGTGGFSFPRKGWTDDEWGIGRLQPFTVFIHKLEGARYTQLHRCYYRYRSTFPRTPRRPITYYCYYYYEFAARVGPPNTRQKLYNRFCDFVKLSGDGEYLQY